MAEPKKRTNKSKSGMRRMQIRATAPTILYCPNCHEAKPAHMVCPTCGQYKGKQVVEMKEKPKVEVSEETK